MLIKQIIFAFALLASSTSFAVISEIAIGTETASGFDSTDPANIIVYGGIAGDTSGCSGGSAVCNTCALVTTLAAPATCNVRSIYPNLNLYVSFKSDTIPAGSSILVKNGTTVVAVIDKTPDASLAVNSELFVKIPWSTICDVGGGGVGCANGAFTAEYQIGVSSATSTTDFSSQGRFTVKSRYVAAGAYHSDAVVTKACAADEGFCDFTMFPGDGKAYVQSLIRGSVGPGDASGLKWNAVRLYYAVDTGNFNQLAPATAQYKDLTVVNKDAIATTVRPGAVDGLTNDVAYMFTMSTVDEAGNVNYFSDPTFLAANPDFYTATPGEVVGLLDDKKCFIATAAFGSNQDPYVFILRNFRDHFLKTNSMGASFVDFYYEHSPKIARFIAKHDSLRAIVRVMLWPLIGFAKASLSFGLGTALALLFGLMTATVVVITRRKRGVA